MEGNQEKIIIVLVMVRKYYYLGDRNTDNVLKGMECAAVMKNGKCIRSKNGNMLVRFNDGTTHVIVARLLRKINR